MDFKKSKTYKNLALSFTAECMAGLRYQMIADLALKENLKTLSDAVKEIAKNEVWHAKEEMKLLNSKAGDVNNINITGDFPFVATTIEKSLKSATEGEKEEAVFYERAFKDAEKEGYADVADKFRMIREIELHHSEIFAEMLKSYKNDTLFKSEEEKTYVCANCGYSCALKEAWKKCPVCESDRGFVKLDFGN